jgi:hypothetical protein
MRLTQDSTDPYARRFTVPNWTRSVTVLDVPRLFSALSEFAGWTRADHARVSAEWLAKAVESQRMYHAEVRRACGTYGDHGPLVSGIVHDHFPEPTKNLLRTLAHAVTTYGDIAHAHYVASGKRSWRKVRSAAFAA